MVLQPLTDFSRPPVGQLVAIALVGRKGMVGDTLVLAIVREGDVSGACRKDLDGKDFRNSAGEPLERAFEFAPGRYYDSRDVTHWARVDFNLSLVTDRGRLLG